MTPAIAIVGMACRYPDAGSPAELWENVLAQRRAFRRMPSERLNAADYYSADPQAPDRTYSITAALIEDYEFDRVRFRVSGAAYRSADLAHWLALDVAERALADAGFPEAQGLPRESTAVYLGNTLTGEFSRAATLRLRWPYVRRVLAAVLAAHGHDSSERAELLREIEGAYKRPFAEIGEETLAGALSNTIAGRISNHFNLKGGGYTVDGACASSLLAVATACSSLVNGDCDLAIAGGVDLSLDPFELVGFAKAGALAPERMRVYDVRSAGFWPGEGCGVAVFMRHDDALAMNRRVYAVVRGWGISSDGSGGITRPEVEGQRLAFQRAYRRAGFGPESVSYFEGHGTGTAVGDTTELRVIARARGQAAPAAISTIKANIGHTKAAAGIAGLIKAAMAVHSQVVPPATGCESPHPEMAGALRALTYPEVWPEELPIRAAVSAMGFGGINSHIVLEGADAVRRQSLSEPEKKLARTPQDCELLLFHSEDQLRRVAEVAQDLSMSELTDLAASLAKRDIGIPTGGTDIPARVALVAGTPEELAGKLANLQCLDRTRTIACATEQQSRDQLQSKPPNPPNFSHHGKTQRSCNTIGFLFPGQGSQNSSAATEIAQPAIIRDSLTALHELRALGIEASVAIGHSLGELTALCWAGALDEEAVVRIAAARGRFMAAVGGPTGAMAGIAAGEAETLGWIESQPVVIAGVNSSHQTVVSGQAEAVNRVIVRARERGYQAVLLPVSHAFHSPLVAGAAEPLARYLTRESFGRLARRVISTVSGGELRPEDDLRELLRRQITMPVRFREALEAAGEVDLWIEVGPGRVLSGLAAATVGVPVLPVESGTRSRRAFLEAVGTAFEMGVPVRGEALFSGRFARPFRGRRKFFVNPCELAPMVDMVQPEGQRAQSPPTPALPDPATGSGQQGRSPRAARPIDVVRELVAERTELPISALHQDARLLADLHLNSIAVAQIATEAARRLERTPPPAPLEYAGLSIAEMARSLATAGPSSQAERATTPAGIDAWVRPFCKRLERCALPAARKMRAAAGEWRFYGVTDDALRDASWPPGGGVVLCLPPEPDERCASLMIEAARAALRLKRPARFVLVQPGSGASGLARTIYLEARDLPVCVVHHPPTPGCVAAEAAAIRHFSEAWYSEAGIRYEPVLALASPAPRPFPLGPGDVLLVTGGGKGIGAECAIEVARTSGATLAILGTSEPVDNPNLERMRALGLRFEYFRADVTNPAAVRAVFSAIGPVTGILHCAGINQPRSIEGLEEAAFQHTIAVKTVGLRNLLEAADAAALKLVVAFGSIIASIGMPGEADYAVANEWLAHDLERWGAAHPGCRCLTLEWSIWSGTGMGERVARLEEMRRAGISPISIEEGVRALHDVLCSDAQGTLVLTGRFGAPPTVRFETPELPLLRFVERTRVHYPGVELVCEADLSVANDPYLEDHLFSGALLLPGVMALEAMAQTAMAVARSEAPPTFEQVRFVRPIIVPPAGALTVRLAALVRSDGQVSVCLRSAETGFQTDHFLAICRFAGRTVNVPAMDTAENVARRGRKEDNHQPVPLDPARDLYGSLLFQQGRFRRLRSYQHLRATECIAEVTSKDLRGWFKRYLPQRLVLGDPGVRDAALHAIQACIPHARVLPGGAAAIAFRAHTASPSYRIQARERRRDGDLLIYDLEITTPEGEWVERWSGLELRIVEAAAVPGHWPPALLAPYLERRISEIVPECPVSVGLGAIDNHNRNGNGFMRRQDGKPLAHGYHVSRSHAGHLTLTVTSPATVGCDCEPVSVRTVAVWRDLLGPAGLALAELVSRETRELLDNAATRVWCALECVKKAGFRQDSGIVLSYPDRGPASASGWVSLAAGAARIATLVVPVAGFGEPLAFAVLVGSDAVV